jgi:hypothetical protein
MQLVIAALFLLLSVMPAQTQTRACDSQTPFQHLVPTGPVEIVVGKPGQRVYPCGFVLSQKGNTLDFKIWASPPGSSCGIDDEDFAPQMALPTDVQLVNRIPTVAGSTKEGYSLCIQTFGSGALTGVIYWAQF